MTIVGIGGGRSLESKAAASYERCLAAGAPSGLTDAWRNPAAQVALFLARYTTSRVAYEVGKVDARRYNGTTYYRKPGMAMVAVPGTSVHEQGRAIDVPEPARSWFAAHGVEHGWHRTIPAEPWHFEYRPWTDQHVSDTTPLKETNMATPAEVWGYANSTDPKDKRADGVTADAYQILRWIWWAIRDLKAAPTPVIDYAKLAAAMPEREPINYARIVEGVANELDAREIKRRTQVKDA